MGKYEIRKLTEKEQYEKNLEYIKTHKDKKLFDETSSVFKSFIACYKQDDDNVPEPARESDYNLFEKIITTPLNVITAVALTPVATIKDLYRQVKLYQAKQEVLKYDKKYNKTNSIVGSGEFRKGNPIQLSTHFKNKFGSTKKLKDEIER